MSSTIKAAIQAIKGRIADAYTAIVAKGGTLPATQDSANLPSAIASIPTGGASGLYDLFADYGVSDASIDAINRTYERDIQDSLPFGTIKNVPYVVYNGNSLASRAFQGYSKVRCIFVKSASVMLYCTFFQCSSLEYIVFEPNTTFTYDSGSYLAFGQCGKLKAIVGAVFEFGGYLQTFLYTNSIREIYIKWTSQNGTNQLNSWALVYDSLLFFVQNLRNDPESGATITMGATNLATLNATTEGQAAIATAQANGWTIA